MGYEKVAAAIENPDLFCVAQIAPAVRVSIGEEFGKKPGTVLTKQLVSALRKAGFDAVFDTSFGADVVVMEEAEEIISKMKISKTPVLSSCCSGFVSYMEHAYPHLVNDLCTSKSPMECEGSLIKTYYAERKGISPEKIYSVAIMPCVVKKVEAMRPELELDGMKVIDHVLTTRETAAFLKSKNINPAKEKPSDFDSFIGHASGAGQIFGVTGGIAEAVFRHIADRKHSLHKKVEFKKVRGLKGIKAGTVEIGGKKFRWAVVNGIRNMHPLFDKKSTLKKYDFIEVMFCSGGCIGGAGQPPTSEEILKQRKEGLYSIDQKEEIWETGINPETNELYESYLGKPGSEKSRKILRTTFHKYYKDK